MFRLAPPALTFSPVREHRAILLAIALVLTAAACGDDDGTDIASAASTTPESVSDQTDADQTDADQTETTVTVPAATTTTTSTASTTTTAAPESGFELTYRNGEVEGGTRDEQVALGDPVRLIVTSDVDEEVHVHGYDIETDVPAGSTQTIEFEADLPGVWEVELHESGTALLSLQVQG